MLAQELAAFRIEDANEQLVPFWIDCPIQSGGGHIKRLPLPRNHPDGRRVGRADNNETVPALTEVS